jgi:hypothetical protein
VEAVQDDVLYVDETCAGVLGGCAVLHRGVGPGLFGREGGADGDVDGGWACIAGVGEVEGKIRVDGEAGGWGDGGVDCLEGWADDAVV